MEAVKVNSFGFKYRGAEDNTLENIHFSLEKGEFLVIMGKTGAGKSTLCFSLNGQIPNFIKGVTSGEIMIFNRRVPDLKPDELARNIGLLFQDFENQLFSTSVQNEIAFLLENLRTGIEEMRVKLEDTIALLGLQDIRDRDPSTLSGGQKQKVAIASILVASPEVIILDEPTTDLDPRERERLLEIIMELRKGGKTVILVENEADVALDADKIMILNSGKIKQQGKPGDILSEYKLLEDNGIKPSESYYLQQKGIPEDFKRIDHRIPNNEVNHDYYTQLLNTEEVSNDNLKEVIIRAKSLSFGYEKQSYVLKSVDLDIKSGEFVAILGHNGSGKTTLAKQMNGLLLPSKGCMEVFSKDTREWNKKELARSVGYVFQNPDHQIFAETVMEEVSFGPRNFGFDKDTTEAWTSAAINALALTGYENADPFSLTKGVRQRVAVASLLASKPRILILDEPTTGLDYNQCQEMAELLRDLNSEGFTIIIITHSMWVACQYSRRTILMHEGEIIGDGSTRQVFADEELLSRTNLIPPPIVKLSNFLGKTCLSIDEFNKVYEI